MADEAGYQRLDEGAPVSARNQPWYKHPGLYVWPCCGLVFFSIIALAVHVAEVSTRSKPDCRKSAPFAIFTQFSHPHAALGEELCRGEPLMLMFGGKGKKVETFDDVWAMCTRSKKWTELVYDGHTLTKNEPHTRWKMAHVTGKGGLYIIGGSELEQDDDDRNTIPAASNGKQYYNDVWSYTVIQSTANNGGWKMLHPGSGFNDNQKSKHSLPEGRRSHIATIYTNPDGDEILVMACGRNHKDEMKNDVWEFNVDKKQWNLLFDGDDKDEGKLFPPGRKGPIAVTVPHPTGDKPYMVIHGGRPNLGYYGDLWAFDLNTNTWEEWYSHPTNLTVDKGPEPRDHHVGHYYNDFVYIHAGRGGLDRVWEDAKEFSDLWEFSITSKTWRKLEPKGPRPIGRWLHTASPVQSYQTKTIQQGVAEMDRFAISGGENMQRCYMNDVWEFHIEKNLWKVVQPCTFCQKSCARDVPAYNT